MLIGFDLISSGEDNNNDGNDNHYQLDIISIGIFYKPVSICINLVCKDKCHDDIQTKRLNSYNNRHEI